MDCIIQTFISAWIIFQFELTLGCELERTARYTEYSNIPSAATWGGSQDRCAPSTDLEILMAEGAPGNPGKHVLKDESCNSS